jgi:hypothetical protein
MSSLPSGQQRTLQWIEHRGPNSEQDVCKGILPISAEIHKPLLPFSALTPLGGQSRSKAEWIKHWPRQE